jgi:hypothetical protein
MDIDAAELRRPKSHAAAGDNRPARRRRRPSKGLSPTPRHIIGADVCVCLSTTEERCLLALAVCLLIIHYRNVNNSTNGSCAFIKKRNLNVVFRLFLLTHPPTKSRQTRHFKKSKIMNRP